MLYKIHLIKQQSYIFQPKEESDKKKQMVAEIAQMVAQDSRLTLQVEMSRRMEECID